MSKLSSLSAATADLTRRLVASGVEPLTAKVRADANAAYIVYNSPAALHALREIDGPVCAWIVEAYREGYAELKGLDPVLWLGEHAASALDLGVLQDRGAQPPAGRSWADVYEVVAIAYGAVAPYKPV